MRNEASRSGSEGERVSCENIQLDRTAEYWVLTCCRSHVILRLRIQRDDVADFDTKDRVIFEANLSEASDFLVLGDALITPCLFSEDGRDLIERPRLDGFPEVFRLDFIELVQRWGNLRALCIFAPTVPGTPFNDQRDR